MARRLRLLVLLGGVAGVLLAGCGDDGTDAAGSGAGGNADRPTIVVTTNILGDVVEAFAGDQAEVVTIMPVGADPHDFQASAQQANQMREADALIVNGAGFEEGLHDVIDAAVDDGTPAFEAIAAVEIIEFGGDGHDHDDEGHADEDHSDDDHSDDDHGGSGHGDAHEGGDPHFFADPARMAVAVDSIADFLIDTIDGVDAGVLRSDADAYVARLDELDEDVQSILSDLSEDQRVLVTNHEVFGYFADRYDFEVVGTVIPGGATTDGASAGALAELAKVVEDEGVPAIFADTSSSNELADTLADEVGEIAVIELFSESLGDTDSAGATYLEMVRTNAERIAEALAG